MPSGSNGSGGSSTRRTLATVLVDSLVTFGALGLVAWETQPITLHGSIIYCPSGDYCPATSDHYFPAQVFLTVHWSVVSQGPAVLTYASENGTGGFTPCGQTGMIGMCSIVSGGGDYTFYVQPSTPEPGSHPVSEVDYTVSYFS